MADLDHMITDLVIGDDYDFDVLVKGVPVGQVVVSGYLTIKKKATDTTNFIQLHIGTSLTSAGIITVSGDFTRLYFTLARDKTALLNPLAEYDYDIEVRTSADKAKTIEKGVIIAQQDVTRL